MCVCVCVCVCVRRLKGGKFKSKQVCETVSHASRSAFNHAFSNLEDALLYTCFA